MLNTKRSQTDRQAGRQTDRRKDRNRQQVAERDRQGDILQERD